MAYFGNTNPTLTPTFGVTGLMGSGKSYCCAVLKKIAEKRGIVCLNVSVDTVRRYILNTSEETDHILLRKQLAILSASDIFSSKNSLQQYNKILMPEIERLIKRDYLPNQGIRIIDWATLIEDEMFSLVNKNILVVSCDPAVRKERLKGGDLPEEEVRKRIACQMNDRERIGHLKKRKDVRFLVFNTSDSPDIIEYQRLFDNILEKFKYA